MSIPRSIFRYLLVAVTIACLAIGLNNCAPSSPTASSPAADTAASSPAADAASTTTASGDRKININTAILSELDKLEAQLGVPALSNKIQAARPYGSPEDLVSKKVVTQAQFDQIKDQVTIEDIVLTGEAKDVDYLTKLGLMKGHMIVAGELLRLNLPEQAEPHLGHPVEEIYVDVQEQLPERNVAEFSDTLTKVQDLVKSKPTDPEVQSAYNDAMTAIDKAIAALPADQLKNPSFVLQSVNEMLDTAAAEYTAAISDGKISAEIEYQDSRGFVAYVKDKLLKDIQPQLAQENAGLDKDLVSKVDTLYTAWPEPVPPQAPVKSADEVANQVKAIEQASAPAIKPTAS
ncbi:helix-hairpin-helix domain-containing protein [Phormidium tenue FACHB-886]|nr:helix-hairpin-helix domain-containing protein [Phormidium tenue FACHB-886]